MKTLILPKPKNTLYRVFALALFFLLLLFFLLSTYQANLFTQKWKGAFDQYITVQIPSFDRQGEAVSEELFKDLVTIVKKTEGISQVDIYSQKEVRHMFESQIIHIQDLENLKLPRLLDVKIEDRDAFNFELFKQDLQAIIGNVEIIADQQLLMPYVKSAQFAETVSLTLSLLILLGLLGYSFLLFKEKLTLFQSYWQYLFHMGCDVRKLYLMLVRSQVILMGIAAFVAMVGFYLFFYWGHSELKLLLPDIFTSEIWSNILFMFFMMVLILLTSHLTLTKLYFKSSLKKWISP